MNFILSFYNYRETVVLFGFVSGRITYTLPDALTSYLSKAHVTRDSSAAAVAAVLPPWQSVYNNKITMRLERVLKFEASVRKTS